MDKVRSKCTVGKLFAKHIKLKDQLSFLRSRDVPVAIGTPSRVADIINADANLLSDVCLLIIDVERDVKLRSIFDIPEIMKPLLGLIFKTLLPKFASGELKMIFSD
jgi:hypothetical protein